MFDFKASLLRLVLVTALVTGSLAGTAEVDVVFSRIDSLCLCRQLSSSFTQSLWYKISPLGSPTETSEEGLDITGMSTNQTAVFL